MLGRFEALPRHLIDFEEINLLFVRFLEGNALVLYVYSDLRQSLDHATHDQMFGRLASQTLYHGDMTLQGGAL